MNTIKAVLGLNAVDEMTWSKRVTILNQQATEEFMGPNGTVRW